MNHQDTKVTKSGPSADVDRLAHEVIGAAIEVHRVLGPGYLESTYETCLGYELSDRGIPFERQAPIHLQYKGQPAGEGRMDLLVDRVLIVELKTVDRLAPIHTAQAISYLKATGLNLALLINFNQAVVKDGIQRVVL